MTSPRGWISLGDEQPEPGVYVLLVDTSHHPSAWPGLRTVCDCESVRECAPKLFERYGRCLACERAERDGTWYRWAGGDQDPPAYPDWWQPMPEWIGG